ncbi:MAG TPA: glycosyltransferase [Gemmatimonadales bacterium]|nr:glycosyltransferase [Gemmatimonadales bacterium]
MDDIRWFAPNRYCTLPVPALRESGLTIALSGNEPAGLAVAADGVCAHEAYDYAQRRHCPLLVYLWDLPPWRLGRGKPDLVFSFTGTVRSIPRLLDRYPERAGYYSRLGYIAQRATEVWCPSTNTARDVASRFGVDPLRVPFCFDSARFHDVSSHKSQVTDHPLPLLSISRLVPHKNHAILLTAAARLNPRRRVRIIGRGPEAEPLRRLGRALGVTLDLTDTWVSDEQIVAAYRVASAVVCPSRFEGFGLTSMEGLAMGLPVIASDIPVHREFMQEAVRYFPPEDDAALLQALESALASSPQPRGRPGFQPPVLADLTIESAAARFLPGLHRLLGGGL